MTITEDRLRQTFSEGVAQEIYQEVKASGEKEKDIEQCRKSINKQKK